jgi:malate synthase
MHQLQGVDLRQSGSPLITPPALAFIAALTRTFRPRLRELLLKRQQRQEEFDRGVLPDFLPETAHIRQSDWSIASTPLELQDRRVEITGPVDRKMVINALNAGASTFMADFEDSTSPTWQNLIQGQQNLYDAVRRQITYINPQTQKSYALVEKPAVLLVRPRGLHLPEQNLLVDASPVPGAFFDFGLYFFLNVQRLLASGSGPYFYLPKLESHLEARLWNDIFTFAQTTLGVPIGSIKATILIETLPAAFEMDEILYELKQHIVGLNCGRWDYIFSFIKKRRNEPAALLPDRSQITMEKGFLRAYAKLLIKTCHRRGAHAIGGMAAQIPIKDDPQANDVALQKVRADKLREVTDGHDGTWVAHPGLVPIAKEIFDARMPTTNQITLRSPEVTADPKELQRELLAVPEGTRTESGLRHNIRVGIQYLEAWLRGNGCVPLYHLMEDAATAEISRAQVWQWAKHEASLQDGGVVTRAHIEKIVEEEMQPFGTAGRFVEAKALFTQLSTQERFEDFLTLPAYQLLE